MHNLHPYEGKTIREIQHRQGGEQIIIYFTDESFLIVSCATVSKYGPYRTESELTFSGRAVES